MKKLTVERAKELKERGITQIASIVKSHYRTEYFKVETIDRILANNGKMTEQCYRYANGYFHGINGRHINWKETIRWSEI